MYPQYERHPCFEINQLFSQGLEQLLHALLAGFFKFQGIRFQYLVGKVLKAQTSAVFAYAASSFSFRSRAVRAEAMPAPSSLISLFLFPNLLLFGLNFQIFCL